MHKLYLSLVMFLTGFNAETLTICAYLRAIVSRPRTEEEGTEQTNAKKKEKERRKKGKGSEGPIHFLLLTALCGRHALTNYTTVSSWCVYWRSSLALCFAFSLWSSGVHTSGPIISHCLGTWVWAEAVPSIIREYGGVFEISTSRNCLIDIMRLYGIIKR